MSEPRTLPTASLETLQAERRARGAEVRARRIERERELATTATRWLGQQGALLEFRDQFTVVAPVGRLIPFLRYLRDELGFDFMNDLSALDTLKLEGDHPERYAVVYHLTCLAQEAQLRVRCYVSEDEPVAPTASEVWPAANWAEREVYDMFGIEFSGHPNLIRILMPTEYSGFPLRKDYPLRGRGERDNFPVIRRDEEELS